MANKAKKVLPITTRAKLREPRNCSVPTPLQKKEKGFWNQAGHLALDVAGLVPGFGEVADGINAGWYAAEGDYENAALSAAAMIPFAGWGATGAKLGMKGYKKTAKAFKSVDKFSKKKVPSLLGAKDPFKAAKWWGSDRHDKVIDKALNPYSKVDPAKESEKTTSGGGTGRQFFTPGLDTPENMKKTNERNKKKEPAKNKKAATRTKSKKTDSWSKAAANNKSGTSLSKLVKQRNSAKKGSAEYAKAQNAINKAYGSKKRY